MYQRIKELCQENGTNITALCLKITGSKGNLSTWKNGNIRPEWLSAISDEFKVSTDYILGKTEVRQRLEDYPKDVQEFMRLMDGQSEEFRQSYLAVLKVSRSQQQ